MAGRIQRQMAGRFSVNLHTCNTGTRMHVYTRQVSHTVSSKCHFYSASFPRKPGFCGGAKKIIYFVIHVCQDQTQVLSDNKFNSQSYVVSEGRKEDSGQPLAGFEPKTLQLKKPTQKADDLLLSHQAQQQKYKQEIAEVKELDSLRVQVTKKKRSQIRDSTDTLNIQLTNLMLNEVKNKKQE